MAGMSPVSAQARGRIVVAAVFGVLIAVAAVVLLITTSGDDGPKVPAYRVVDRTSEGGQEVIRVEVDTHPGADGLRRIFDTVQSRTETNGGHRVHIDCATGADRLASGTFGKGDLGVAQTGLAEGYVRWLVTNVPACPAG